MELMQATKQANQPKKASYLNGIPGDNTGGKLPWGPTAAPQVGNPTSYSPMKKKRLIRHRKDQLSSLV